MGRTHLTTPPGEPLFVDGPTVRTEQWSAGPRVPVEPSWPGRLRRAWLTLCSLVVVVAITLAYLWANQRANVQDPSFAPEVRFTESEGSP